MNALFSESKVLTVLAPDAQTARQRPRVQKATEEGWQVQSARPLGFTRISRTETTAPGDAGENASDEETTSGIYLLKLKRSRIAKPGSWSNALLPWRRSDP